MNGDVLLRGDSYGGENPLLERGSDVWMEANQTSARLFEQSKISALRDERENVQKKTFTKWVNSHLQKVNAHINDLYHDLQDGRQLILLLEILSAEKLPRPSKGRMRIHMLENVEHALVFLKKKKVHLTNIGNHDIVDGNPKITLGLIWTIILRFQIQDIMIEMDSTEKRSAKDALLLWCQSKTQGYANVNVSNFTTSWRDGMAFNAIIHKHRPDLVDMKQLVKEEPITALDTAFDTAERELGIFRLLDAPDVCVDYPDEKSIMTYVATYYQYFSKMKQVEVSGSRIQNVIKQALDNETLVKEYENLSSDLMKWIRARIVKLQDRQLGNSLATVQQKLTEFNMYRTQEKPPKYVEKGNLEVLMFEITSQLRLNHQKMYNPPENLLISDINRAWIELEQEEHKREVALREELIRQQQLEQLAGRFERKAKLRHAWLNENCKLLNTDSFGEDLSAVEASVKKHEAIETDIKAYEARIDGVEVLTTQLEQENFHRAQAIREWADKIQQLWREILKLLQLRSSRLNKHLQIHRVFQEMIYIIDWMDDLKKGLESEDFGTHLVGVEDLLQKHDLIAADISAQADRVKNTNAAANQFLNDVKDSEDGYKVDSATIRANQSEVETTYEKLCDLAAKRKQRLEESLLLHTFYRDREEEEIWLSEKEYFASSTEYGHDSLTTNLFLQQHKALELELASKKPHSDKLLEHGGTLATEMPYATEKIGTLSQTLRDKWAAINALAEHRRTRLEEIARLHQYLADCREIEADITELEAPVASTDYGKDEDSATDLLRGNEKIAEQLNAIEKAIKDVEEQKDSALGEQDQNSPEVIEALNSVKEHYSKLLEQLVARRQRLLAAINLFRLQADAEHVRTWIVERKSRLATYMQIDRTYDLERCTVVKHRFEVYENELSANNDRLNNINEMTEKLKESDPEASIDVVKRVENLNRSLESLKEEANDKKKEIDACLSIQTLYSEMTETQSWIVEKCGLLTSVEDVGADLSSVISLQRRLNTIERDIAALPAKMQGLQRRAVDLAREYPEEAINIQDKFDDMQSAWENLTKMVKEKNESLLETGELKRFIMALDDFLTWVQQTSETCSSEELPQSLSEAEAMLDNHFELNTVIEQHKDDYEHLSREGPKYIRDEQTDLQTQSLRQQMADVDDGWVQLHVKWEARKVRLEQSMNQQLFLRDSKQCEAILSQQELYLSKQRTMPTADSVQVEVNNLEEFFTKMDAQDEKINHIINFSDQLQLNNHYAKEKILEKAQHINDRRTANRAQADKLLNDLINELQLKQFLEDSAEVLDWTNERLQAVSDESYKEQTNVRSKLLKHQVFEAELTASKTKLDLLKQSGEEIITNNEQSRDVVEERLDNIDRLWQELNRISKEKKDYLTESNRQQQFANELANLDKWIGEVQGQIEDKQPGTDIVSARELHDKHKRIESDVVAKKERMVELCKNPDEVDEEKIIAEQQIMKERFEALEAPLVERREILDKSLDFYQYKRDVEDAQVWIKEKEPILQSENLGSSLHDVQRSKKRHSNLNMEIRGHEPLIEDLVSRAGNMAKHPRAEEIAGLRHALVEQWDMLKTLSGEQQEKLDESLQAKQYFFDAAEAESWMSEQELFLLGDDRGKDEEHVQKMLKKQLAVENAITLFRSTLDQLNATAQGLTQQNHPESDTVQCTQTRLEELYSRLRELCTQRQDRLDENLKLFQYDREVQDLLSWIADREQVASSQDIGQDFDQVQILEERFSRFVQETQFTGAERVKCVNAVCQQLIDDQHADATTLQEWKDNLNEQWQSLLELLETRTELLRSGHEYHLFFHEARETLNLIEDKVKNLTDELGRDQQSVYALQRQHKTFEADLKALGHQVEGIQQFGSELKSHYAGDDYMQIVDQQADVVEAWQDLLARVSGRGRRLAHSDMFQAWLALINNLLLWIQDMRTQIQSDEKAKDIPGCEILMGAHQTRKTEIDGKESKFQEALRVADDLLALEDFYAPNEVTERVGDLKEKKKLLEETWDVHWEDLQLTLEVMQFARDAQFAEDWVLQNQHSISGKEFDKFAVEEITKLIERHTNFERLLCNQEERFNNLERLTTFELRNARQKQLEAAKKEREEKERLERDLSEEREREAENKRIKEQNEKLEAIKASELQSTNTSSESPTHESSTDEVDAVKDLVEGADGITFFGPVSRKPTKEGQNKKAHQRVWKDFYAVLKNNELLFYKDKTDAVQNENIYSTLTLTNNDVGVASDYKKKHTLRLNLQNGFEYLVQLKSNDEMAKWIQKIRGAAVDVNATDDQIRERLSTITSSPSRPSAKITTPEPPHTPDEQASKKDKKKSSLFKKSKKSQKGDKTPTKIET